MPTTLGNSDGFSVSLDRPDQLSYALSFGGLPVITNLSIASTNQSRLSGATVHLTVESLGAALCEKWSHRAVAGDSGVFEVVRPEIIWKASPLLGIADTQPAELIVAIEQADGAVTTITIPWTVSSPDAWYEHSAIGPLSLAAFVRPNDPRLREILDKASAILLAKTGDGGLSGYQSAPRVLPMVEAIYDAVQGLEITYSNPPASWDMKSEDGSHLGQKIRSTATIVDERVGTCLDTAVLFAALLENVGLYPLIALVPGHAFVGFWAPNRFSEAKLPNNQVGPLRSQINELDIGQLFFFETTVVAKSPSPVSFTNALGFGRSHIANYATDPKLDERSHYLDIVACRRPGPRQVLAMPIRRVLPDGTVEIFEYRPEEFTVNMLLDKLSAEMAGKDSGFSGIDLDVPPRLRIWLDSLLDLSLRNPLINFRFPRTSLPLLIPPGAIGAVEDMLAQETPLTVGAVEGKNGVPELLADKRLEVPPNLVEFVVDQLRSRTLIGAYSTEYSLKLLRSMSSQAKSVVEETGSNGLFLALGFLSWDADRKQRFTSQTADHITGSGLDPDSDTAKGLRSPLILIPVVLTPKNRFREFTLSLDTTSPITPNFSLIEKLRRDYGVALDPLANLEEDDSGVDIPKALDGIRKAVKDAGLEGFRVDEGAVLGFFNFSTYRLWKDLVDNWRILSKSPLFHHLLHTPYQPFNPEGPKELSSESPSRAPQDDADENNEPLTEDPVEDVVGEVDLDALIGELPIPADASQARAVARASRGETFVLQGPPGTGKSQTITNMLAHGLQKGQRVLFVAQKKEALDVVKERLDQVGLGGFSLDLHDKNQSLKAVKSQLLEVLEKESAVDAVGFEVALKEYHQAFAPLRRYRERLHELGAHGESLYRAMDLLLATPSTDALTVSAAFIANHPAEARDVALSALRQLVETGPVAGSAAANPWSFALHAVQPDEAAPSLIDLLERLDRSQRTVQSDPNTWAYLRGISSREELRQSLLLTADEANPLSVAEHTTELSRQARYVAEASVKRLLDALGERDDDLSPANSLDIDDLISQDHASKTKNAIARFLSLQKLHKTINRTFGRPLATTRADVPNVLSALQDIEVLVKTARADLERVPGLRLPGASNLFSLADVKSIDAALARVSSIVSLVDSSSDRGTASAQQVISSFVGRPEFRDALDEWVQSANLLCDQVGATPASVELWASGLPVGQRLADALASLKDDLSNHGSIQQQRWLQLATDLEPLRELGLDSAVYDLLSGRVNFADGPNAFLKGYYTALVDFLMVERGFNTFDQAPLNAYVTKFTNAQRELQAALPEVLSAELIGRRGFDMSMKLGAIGDLLAEVKKLTSRRGSVRLLLRKHWDLIRRITPCVLASPDSVVRFIDADLETFDLVIFDEASMIKVATALGAIGRAKAAIVVGDTKQMPPTSVAQAKNSSDDDDGDEDFVEDMESILSQVEVARLPEVMLKWHYRSEDESLIGFSNNRYYNDKLLTFPSAQAKRSGYGLDFVHLPDGHFNRRSDKKRAGDVGTNPREAKAIVDTIAGLLSDPSRSRDSIGVVTLNLHQQKLITEMLQEHPSEAIQHALTEGSQGETIFVKNLETVQGSERDVILFSVAFSKNHNGQLPLNFGPLNNAGGERRLNVAVTRARKQMVVFSSFTGTELLNREPSSDGVVQLGEFLQRAQLGVDSSAGASAGTPTARDRHQDNVAERLRDAGLLVKTDVGISGFRVDIAIYDPSDDSHAILGILLDGQRWSTRETVSDRDALPVSFLEGRMGWPRITRMWLPSWIRHPEDEINRILGLVGSPLIPAETTQASTVAAQTMKPEQKDQAFEPPSVGGADATEQAQTEDWLGDSADTSVDTVSSFRILSDSALSETTSWDTLIEAIETWRALRPSQVGGQEYMDYLRAPEVQKVVQDIAKQLTEYEGPVSRERFAKFVAACFGFTRVVKNRVESINQVPLPGHSRDNEGFLFPAGQKTEEYSGWRRGGGSDARALTDISLQEISNAMVHLAEISMGISASDIVSETARVLGIQRSSSAIVARMDAALALCLKLGRLADDGGYLKATKG